MPHSLAPDPQDQTGAMQLLPLERFQGSLGQRVYQSLKHAILTLAYRPGDIIRKPEICDRLRVSRSPVADAVAKLATDGLVDVVPQAGTFVTRLSMTDIREGAFIREAIEVAAAEHVAPRITEDQLRDLRRSLKLQEALVADGDAQGFMALDSRQPGRPPGSEMHPDCPAFPAQVFGAPAQNRCHPSTWSAAL